VKQYGEIEFEFETNKQMEKMCPCSQKYNTKQVDVSTSTDSPLALMAFLNSDVSIRVSDFDINWIL
jgi:hypothetical protein